MSGSVQPGRWQPTRLPRPWDSPGKNTGVGCHFLLHVLATINSASVNNGLHVSFSVLVSSGCISRSGITESYGGFIPNFLRNLHTVFYSGCINVHFYQQCKSIPFSSHSPAFNVCRLFGDGHSDWYEVISYCSVDLHFSNNEQ